MKSIWVHASNKTVLVALGILFIIAIKNNSLVWSVFGATWLIVNTFIYSAYCELEKRNML